MIHLPLSLSFYYINILVLVRTSRRQEQISFYTKSEGVKEGGVPGRAGVVWGNTHICRS